MREHEPPPTGVIEAELSRDLGLVSALAIGVGTMIAAGIFTLSGLAVRNVGSSAIVAFLLAAVVATFTALSYCEFAALYPRSGEGYLYARKTFSPPAAWLVGWCLLLGYCSSCAFYIASLSTYFQEFIWHSPFQQASGLVALGCLTLLNMKGTKESGTFQVVVTLGKVILLCWFVFGGLGSVTGEMVVEKFNKDFLRIGGTAAMVFITFFGFSAIAASAGEVKDPVKNIPRAIFISMGVVTVLYTLVVLTMLGAGLTEYDEAAMGRAAELFLGPVGGTVIVGGAIFSMISASNASIMAGSRVAMAMSQMGHLSPILRRIHPRTRTPIAAILLVGGLIGIFASTLPLEDLAHYADTVLLLALTLVNAALIKHRRMYPDMERPFRVPFVPVLPALGIVANLALLAQITQHHTPFQLALGSLFLGVVGFWAWKGTRPEEKEMPGGESRVALERASISRPGQFRVLVPIANPASIDAFIDLAASVAKERDGEILALRVVTVPEQVSPRLEHSLIQKQAEILERARSRGRELGVPVTTLVVVGYNVARAILETTHGRHCNLVVLGWKGYTSTARRILGEITDTIVSQAKADIIVVKQVGQEPLRRFFLPTVGGEHARLAEDYTASLARAQGGTMTIGRIIRSDSSEEVRQQAVETLDKAVERLQDMGDLQKRLLESQDIVECIVREGQSHDAIVIGASGRSSYRQLLLGNIPEQVVRKSRKTVLIVKRHNPVKALVARVMTS